MFDFINKHRRISVAAVCSLATAALLMIILVYNGFAPFGNRTFATADAYIQYIDFFSYFKDVLSGENSILYTLSESLGKDTLTTFSYYLASPFNLLVVFFEKSRLHIFFNFIVVLKLLLAAFTMSWFISCRFKNRISPVWNIALTLCYVFSHYNVTQVNNIMWIDGVYMLPLVILGVHYAVTKRKIGLLTLSAALCILFNWYSAGIVCLFSIIWFFFELALSLSQKGGETIQKVKSGLVSTACYGAAMVFAVLIGGVLFCPTVFGLLGGKGTSEVVDSIFSGNALSVIGNWRIGACADRDSPVLFCGTLVLIGCIGFFISKRFTKTKKAVYGGLLFASLIIYFWYPLFWVFSLLNLASSYWYRYSFVSVFALIFIAASFFEDFDAKEHKWMPAAGIGISLILFIIDYLKGSPDVQCLYYSAILFTAAAFAIKAVVKNKDTARRTLKTVMLCVVAFELVVNANILLVKKEYSKVYNDFDLNYQTQQQKIIDKIQSDDPDNYRISQTSYRYNCSYNEAMAYGYWSPASYTSSPDMSQLDFLDRLGYRKEGDCITVVNTSLVSADSLLGVRYVLSDKDINGLVKLEDYGVHNNKYVYSNPYCLPMSFTVKDIGAQAAFEGNPFTYQNGLYSALMGEDVEIFKSVQYEVSEDKDTLTYTLSVPDGNFAVYGNVSPAKMSESVSVSINDSLTHSVGGWLESPLFYIPVEKGDEYAYLTLSDTDYESITELQVYALDLDELERVSKEISKNHVKGEGIGTDEMKFTVTSDGAGSLVLSIPASENWSVTVNGKKTDVGRFGGCLMTVPLENGENTVAFSYEIKGLKLGADMSVIGIVFFALWFVMLKYMSFIMKLLNHPTVKYIIAGGCTTAVNFLVFTLLRYVWHIDVNVSNIISIICSVLFAYFANKIYVFGSKTNGYKELAAEFTKFVGARGITMIIEVGGVFVLDLLHWNGLVAKLITQVIVLVTNYVFSKVFVFKGKEND